MRRFDDKPLPDEARRRVAGAWMMLQTLGDIRPPRHCREESDAAACRSRTARDRLLRQPFGDLIEPKWIKRCLPGAGWSRSWSGMGMMRSSATTQHGARCLAGIRWIARRMAGFFESIVGADGSSHPDIREALPDGDALHWGICVLPGQCEKRKAEPIGQFETRKMEGARLRGSSSQ